MSRDTMMDPMYAVMTPAERAHLIATCARELVALAEHLGICLRIERVSQQPPAMGNLKTVVEAWPNPRVTLPAP